MYVVIDPKFVRAEELGIRLEVVAGLPIWEAAPVYRHPRAVDGWPRALSRARAWL